LNISQLLSQHPRAAHTFRFDFIAMLFTGAVLACIHMLDVIGSKAYDAGSFEIALIRSGMGFGMIASYLVANRVIHHRRVPYVTWPQTVARMLLVSLAILPWLRMNWVLPYFCFCAVLASALEHLTLPARLTLYRHNYPVKLRPLVASRVRQAQIAMVLFVGLSLGILLDWNTDQPEGLGLWLTQWVPHDLFPKDIFLRFGVPVIAGISMAGIFLFSRIREKANLRNLNNDIHKIKTPGIKEWISVLFGNKSFLIFEIAYFIFGFGNLMTLPLLVILVTKPEYGINASYFESMLVLSVVWQVGLFLAAPLMGKLVQRYNPILLRGILTLSFAIDLFLMFFAYLSASILPLYIGKTIRGVTMAGGMLIWELGPMYFAEKKEEVPTYIGIHTVLTGVRALISPWVGASLASLFTLGTAVLMGAFMQVVAGAILIIYFIMAKDEPLLLKDAPKEISSRSQGQIT